MVSKRRNDKRSIGRRSPKRPPKYRILVVCEGSGTEPEYFRALQHYARNPRVQVKVPDEPGVPLTVVKTAIRLSEEAVADAKGQRDENLRYGSVWAVFDVDAHPNLHEEAVKRAMALEVEGAQHGDSRRNPSTAVYKLTEMIRFK